MPADRETLVAQHDLKVWPEFFSPLLTGEKTFEIRRDDRGFRAGDVLLLREWTRAAGYTGREMRREVSYLLGGLGWGILPGYVCMALSAQPQEGESDA